MGRVGRVIGNTTIFFFGLIMGFYILGSQRMQKDIFLECPRQSFGSPGLNIVSQGKQSRSTIPTVLPAKSDSDVIFCLQLLSKTLT